MIVEPFLIVTMAALDLSVVTRCAGADSFVNDSQFAAHDIKRVRPVCFLQVSEFSSVICLQNLWLIAKVSNGTPQEING